MKREGKRQNPEYELQKSIVDFLKARRVLFCASAGGMRTNLITAIKMKKAGYVKGFPDIFIYEPRGKFHGVAIEVKAEKGVQSLEQKEWQKDLESRNYKYIILKGNENFYVIANLIDDYLKNDRSS